MDRYFHCAKFGILIFLSTSLLFACDSSKEQRGGKNSQSAIEHSEELWNDNEKEVSLNELLDSILDNLQHLEKKAFASEKEKIEGSKKLVEEIKLTVRKYNRKLLDSVVLYQAKMQAAAYTKGNLDNLEAMEKYDFATLQMINAIEKLAIQIPNFTNYQRAYILYQDIITADRSDFTIRKDYNSYASTLNALLQTQRSAIENEGIDYKNIQQVKLFYGNPDS